MNETEKVKRMMAEMVCAFLISRIKSFLISSTIRLTCIKLQLVAQIYIKLREFGFRIEAYNKCMFYPINTDLKFFKNRCRTNQGNHIHIKHI